MRINKFEEIIAEQEFKRFYRSTCEISKMISGLVKKL